MRRDHLQPQYYNEHSDNMISEKSDVVSEVSSIISDVSEMILDIQYNA